MTPNVMGVFIAGSEKKRDTCSPKTKMEPENGPLEKKRCVFLKTVIFLVSC